MTSRARTRRRTRRGRAVLAVRRFIPDIVDHAYLVLGTCERCGHEVPTHAIASLVDLGRVLDGSGGDTLAASSARWDVGHAAGCPLYRPDDDA